MRSAPARRRLSIMGLLALALAVVGAAAVAAPASAAPLLVTSSADSGAGSLRDVLASAAAGDTVTFAPSVTSIALLSSVPIAVGVTIQGPGSDVLTISKGNASNFVMLSLDPDVVDQDFVVEGIHFDGTGGGTGVAVYAGLEGDEQVRDVTLRDLLVTNVQGALGSGFATFQMLGDVLIEDSVFRNGSALFGGGALSLEVIGGTLTVRNSVFDSNTAGQFGGAIYYDSETIDENDITIDGCDFVDNTAQTGGAIRISHIADGTGTDITSSTFEGNTANDGDGGAISVGIETGGFFVGSSTFTGNSALGTGTSIDIDLAEGQAGTENVTIDESLDDVAAINIDLLTGGFFVGHSTIVAPSALSIVETTDDLMGVENSILDVTDAAAIVVGTGAPVAVRFTAFSTTGSTDDIVDVEGNLFSVNPLLGALADNGGPTQTRLPAATSPVINAGDPGVTTSPEFDQRGTGFARVVGGRVDMGAVETRPALAATGGTVAWWAIAGGAGALVLGVGALVLAARRRAS